MLIVFGVVTDFTAARCSFPPVFTHGYPFGFVPTFALSDIMFGVHERVVEETEIESQQRAVSCNRGIGVVSGIDGNAPRSVLERCVDMLEELALVGIVWEVFALPSRRKSVVIEDMVFAPVTESDLDECDTRVVVVPSSEIGIELFGKPFELIVGPVSIEGFSISLHCLAVFRSIAVASVLYIERNGGGTGLVAGTGRDVLESLVRVFVAESNDGLMSARNNVVQ